MALPHYYSSLGPFRDLFRTGPPVLTYHHLGRRPRGARLKGMYVSPKLFSRQIAELHQAGFATTDLGPALRSGKNVNQQLVLTFDDGFRDVIENALPVLQQHRFRAIQFLVSDLIGKSNEWQQRAGDVSEPLMDEAQVRDWLATGQQIGSHTRTHPWLTRLSRADAREEISGSKKALENRFGLMVENFCYPYGDWNEIVRELVIEAGYKTACTTISGINTAADSPFALKRFTARYPSRNLKAIWRRLCHGAHDSDHAACEL
jgi:peptidoglycan/xylan/chitin deacetylase (PgdA/CDA1 family)